MSQFLRNRVSKAYNEMIKSGLGPCPPFAVVNANSYIIEKDKRVFVRKSSWGLQSIEEPQETDIQLLFAMATSYLCFPLMAHTDLLFNKHRRKETRKLKHQLNRESMLTGIVWGIGIGVIVSTIGFFMTKIKKQ